MDKIFKPDKPFKTHAEMVRRLQTFHNLECLDPAWAASTLKLVPYYDLVNGYKDLFMINDKFKPAVTFEYLYLFHAFDRGFQNVLFEFSVVIEDYFKNNLSYILAKDFGVRVDDYLSCTNFLSSRGPISFESVKRNITGVYQSKPPYGIEEPTRHYLQNHNHIPPWILLKNVTFSNSINLFSLMKPAQKEELSSMLVSKPIPIHEKIQFIYYTLTLIRKFRNVIAHNLKFISFNCKKYSRAIHMKSFKRFVPGELLTWKDLHKQVGIYDIYGYIILTFSLLPNSIEKIALVRNLISFIDNYLHGISLNENIFLTYCAFTGIPADIVSRLNLYADSILHKVPLPTVAKR